ncbi:virulence-associated E family protein [Listeria rocourtiae]|uniref:virulence-associated E family protein n=1 Tax=Listeria rocourtiae TaxID=647910 RepID=UPI0016232A59|nr:virulence-associated E family protein [Listeria rocourtiae]
MNAKDIAISTDGKLTLAVGKSRKEKAWKNKETTWSKVLEKISQTTRTAETFDEYLEMPKSEQAKVKDIGGFVGGTLLKGRRKAENVKWRQLITLDADFAKPGLWEEIELFYDFACAVYSTHKHSPEKPRLRVVIPLLRAVTPDEYQAVSRRIAADLDIDVFDDTTYQPHRLMYWPSTAKDGDFEFQYQDGAWLDPDAVLATYDDWTDPSFWPESSRRQNARKKLADRQGNPLDKSGIVGAFCKTYMIQDAIEVFLSDKYEPAMDGRYTYVDGSTVGGLVLYEDGLFAYSHHGTDPISEKLVNAFDLVRIHLFGAQDDDAPESTPVNRLPSFLAMSDFAREDDNIKENLVESSLSGALEDFADILDEDGDAEATDKRWMHKLSVNRNGKVASSAPNILLILENDPYLKGKFGYNEFNYRMSLLGNVPWRKIKKLDEKKDLDDSALRNYLETVYEISGRDKIKDALREIMHRQRFHPVRDYLNGLEWDGKERLDAVIIDYLGAEDSEYTRVVTRKTFAAAVARVVVPGTKFDQVLTLTGKQGLGKSTLLDKLGKEWYSDSLEDLHGKAAYELLQGYWIMELGELSALNKTEVEKAKAFISAREDRFRVAYGENVQGFPRQCIFIATTNDNTFLRDGTGNRRFWPIEVHGYGKKSVFTDLKEDVVDQIWAEAFVRYQEGETLYLQGELEQQARAQQAKFTESNILEGLIREYLETPIPPDWADKNIAERKNFLLGADFEEVKREDLVLREKVCAMEIWCEMMDGEPKQLTKQKAREINEALRNIENWQDHQGLLRFGKQYGRQRAYTRIPLLD